MSVPQPPKYRFRPILSLATLARTLRIPLSELMAVASQCDSLYRAAKPQPKPDGTFRETFDARPRLKRIHTEIQARILRGVDYPSYITGSVKGKDARANALIHAGAKIAICEDIDSFFPSLGRDAVYDIWRNFFGFSPEVADLLTRLCLKGGVVPQGAITSPGIANLAFWRHEAALHAHLAAQCIRYSRYVDDITVSAPHALSAEEKSECIRRIYGLMFAVGTRPKRRKHEVFTSGHRMVATKLVINKKPGLPARVRSAVRAGVRQLEMQVVTAPSPALWSDVNRLSGRAAYVKSLHPKEGAELLERVREVRVQLRELLAPDISVTTADASS